MGKVEDLKAAKKARIVRVIQQAIIDASSEATALKEEVMAEDILDAIELAEIEEQERWHNVERNSPQEGKEE